MSVITESMLVATSSQVFGVDVWLVRFVLLIRRCQFLPQGPCSASLSGTGVKTFPGCGSIRSLDKPNRSMNG